MISRFRLTLLLLPLFAFLVACGGSGDSSDDASNGSDTTGPGKPGSASGSGSQKSKKSGTIPDIKDGAFQKGTIRVEITGDKRSTVNLDGNGYAQSGALLLTYASNEAGAFLTFVPEKSDDEGGFAITTKELATAGTWGKECDMTVDAQGEKVSGEFECNKIDAVVPGEAKTYRINLKVKFSAER
ncbi:MAG: hypothetical protein C0506_11710 [Anaerolinea sp.]|nr:hypothetical protein [Anaerolinea sp.]